MVKCYKCGKNIGFFRRAHLYEVDGKAVHLCSECDKKFLEKNKGSKRKKKKRENNIKEEKQQLQDPWRIIGWIILGFFIAFCILLILTFLGSIVSIFLG